MNYVVYTIKKTNRTSTANSTLFHSEILHLRSESSSRSLGEPMVQSHPYCMFPASASYPSYRGWNFSSGFTGAPKHRLCIEVIPNERKEKGVEG